MSRALLIAVLAAVSWGAVAARNISPADLEPFADGVIETSMEENDVAGVVVGVVANGEVVLLKGYGEADIEAGTKVDPATTMFRPGSVTKLFTWVALMQLEDQGKIDFDTDINEYLTGVQIPATFDEPVTIRHLMTHTPGFEDHVIGLFGRDETSLRPLVELLNEEMPLRVREPGTYSSYSNHGVAMAGLMVEQVSGKPWEAYIEDHILTPLDMNHTTMRQPLPEDLVPHMSEGYLYQRGKYQQQSFEYVPAAPAGSASASGADMVRFIQMFLNGGVLDGKRVLAPQLVREMREPLFETAAGNNALLHGFYETSSHDEFIMGHGGDTLWFHSELQLMPDTGVGWFISTNSQGGGAVRNAFHKGFLDRYFGPSQPAPGDFERTNLDNLVGTYAGLRHSHDDLTKMMQLVSGLTIARSPDDELMLVGGENVGYFEEIAPLTFKNKDGETRLSFKVNDNGVATHMYISTAPTVAFEKLSGLDSPGFHNAILALSAVVFAWVLIVWTVQRFTRRFVLPVSVARFRLSAWWLTVSVVVFVAATLLSLDNPTDIVFGIEPPLSYVLVIPYVTMTLAVITLLLYVPVMRELALGRVARFGYFLVAITGIAFTWFLTYWQVI